jgi:hypothetical protein
MNAQSFRTLAAVLAASALGGLLTVVSACADASLQPDPRSGGPGAARSSRPDGLGPSRGAATRPHGARAPSPGLRIRPQSYLPAPAILGARPAAATPRCVSGSALSVGNCPGAYPYGSPSSGPPSRVDSRLPSIGGPWQPWQGRGLGYFGRAPGVPGILPPQPLPPHLSFPSPIGGGIHAPGIGASGGVHVAPPGAFAR